MLFNIVTIFPDLIDSYSKESILGRGQEAGVIRVRAINLRDFTEDKHKTVDDTPYGGGAGMILKPEPVYRALTSLGALRVDTLPISDSFYQPESSRGLARKTVLLSPGGRQFDQRVVEEWSRLEVLTLVCGRYEGIDQRVADFMVDEQISIGPYVLAGGELGALVIVEAVSRLILGVLGNPQSLVEETFNTPTDQDIHIPTSSAMVEYPQYTKPQKFVGWPVPDILLSGNHKEIAAWRRSHEVFHS